MSQSNGGQSMPMGWQSRRKSVVERDKNRCSCCKRPKSEVEYLDVDHIVPRGIGGSEQYSNLITLCRQCHEAKTGDRLPPTLELQSTGEMTEYEFFWFRQFLKEIVPALSTHIGHTLQPKFRLDERKVWHLPMGDVYTLDSVLASEVSEYSSLQITEYM